MKESTIEYIRRAIEYLEQLPSVSFYYHVFSPAYRRALYFLVRVKDMAKHPHQKNTRNMDKDNMRLKNTNNDNTKREPNTATESQVQAAVVKVIEDFTEDLIALGNLNR